MTKSEQYFVNHGYSVKGTKKCEGCDTTFNVYLKRDIERKRFCSRECFGRINSKQNGLRPPHPSTLDPSVVQKKRQKAAATTKKKMALGLIPKPPVSIIDPITREKRIEKKHESESRILFKEVKISFLCQECGKKRNVRNIKGEELFKLCGSCSNTSRKKEVTYACQNCGLQRTVRKHVYDNSENHFCGQKCMYEWRTKQPSRNKLTLSCPHCKKEFKRFKSQCSGKQVFCSRSCKSLSISKKGPDNPLYKNGSLPFRKSIKRNRHYKNWYKAVYRRDEFTCQKCGSKKDLHAHHIIHFASLLDEFLSTHHKLSVIDNKDELLELAFKHPPFWDVSNGKTLCKECHQLEHPNINLNISKNALI